MAGVTWDESQESAKPLRWTLQHSLAAAMVVIMLSVAVMQWRYNSDIPAQSLAGDPAADDISLLQNPALQGVLANPDDFPVYSPDGRFVVYPRYIEEGKAHLWAHDLAYGNDFLMTDEAGRFEHLVWSRDSSMLIFVDAADSCASLKAVAVSQAETNALVVDRLTPCMEQRLAAPEWINNRALAFITIGNNISSIEQLDLKTMTTRQLLSSAEEVPYHLSYSPQTSILTIMAIDDEGQKELLFLDTTSGTINKNERAVFTPAVSFYSGSNSLQQ